MRLIDADKLYPDCMTKDGKLAISQSQLANASTVEERPQGEWKLDDTEQFCYCDQCEDTYYPRPLDPSWNYCPHCGADMRGNGNEVN